MLRRALKRVVAIAASLLVALLLAEGLLRIVDPFHTAEVLEREAFQRAILEPHPTLPHAVLRKGAKASFLGHEAEINADRMRGPLVEHAKPAGVFRIVVAGDSIAFGWAVDEADSFPRVLERLLNDGPKPPGVARFEVVNGGTPGWGIASYFVFLQEIGLRLEPDLVVVTFINNDLTDIIRIVEGEAARPDPRLGLPTWSQGLYLARAIKDVHDILVGSQGDFFLELESAPELTEPAIDRACQLFEMMRDECGATPLVVVDTLGDASGNRLDRFVAGLEALGIPRIEAFLPKARYAHEFAVSAIDMHPNALGHRRFAEWIRDWVVERFVE